MKLFPPFSLDTVNECLWRSSEAGADEPVLLTPKSFEVLRYLVEHPGRLVTHRELLDSVWPGTFIEPQAVKKQIFDLRRALDDPPRTPRFIETLPRRGYRFVAPVEDGTVRIAPILPAPLPSQLVGRDRELAELHQSLRRATAGERQIVFLTGEPGIGKTALSDEFQRQAFARDPSVRIARAQCVEGFGSKEPFAPILDALGQLSRGDGGGAVLTILAARAPTWLVHFTSFLGEEQRERLQREVLGATRERSLRELIDALETIAAGTLLLLVLEDIHWVDYSTLDVISGLARGRSPAKLMLITTYRPADPVLSQHPLPALKADLVARGCGREMALRSLSEPEIAQYLSAESSGHQAPTNLAALIHRYSDGNPLFMIGVVEYMNAQGLIGQTNGTWHLLRSPATADLKVPESLRQMIESQVQSLAAEDQRVLEVASIAGITFTPFISAATANLDPAQFEDRCDALARRNHLLRVADTQVLPNGTLVQRYEFLHALYREVLYERQAPAHRAALHRCLAEQLEAVFANQLSDLAQELAHHFEAGADWPGAVIYLRLAADVAARRYASREATANLQHALELAGKLPLPARATAETQILDRLAGMYLVSFDPRVVETYEALRARAARYHLVDVEVRALIDMAYPISWRSTAGCLEVVDRALNLSAAQGDSFMQARTRASCLVRRIWAAGWNQQDADSCREAMAEIRRSGSPLVVALHTLECNFLEWSSSRYREARGSAVESLSILLDQSQENPHVSFAYWLSQFTEPWSLLFLGEWGEALKEIDAGILMAEKNSDQKRAQTLLLYRAWVHLFGMDPGKACEICQSVLPRLDQPEWRPWRRFALMIAGSADVGLGNYDRALERLVMAKTEMEQIQVINDWYCSMGIELALTELWLAKGELTPARESGKALLAVTGVTAERTWQAMAWEVNARLAQAAGDAARAEECIALALSAMEGFEVPLAGWRVHATAAELSDRQGDTEAAERHHRLSRATIDQLAQSLPAGEPLRETFLQAVRGSGGQEVGRGR